MEALLQSGREAGTPAVARAREHVAAHLRALGLRVDSVPFSCTSASLLGFPVFGAALGWLSLLMLLLLTSTVPAWAPIVLWVAGLGAAALPAAALGLGWTTLGLPVRDDANLVAWRDGAPVVRWLVAHLDSKAQGHSMAGRLVAVWIAAVAALSLTVLALVRLGGPVPLGLVAPVGTLGLAAGFLLGRGRLRGESPGARDNGSGLLACLMAAADLGPGTGVVVTGAEEFGLLGARALLGSRPELFRGCEIINLDTLDDRGNLYVVHHDPAGATLAGRVAQRLTMEGVATCVRALPIGILTDSVAFARAGLPAVTVARLDWATLRRIHTPRDTMSAFQLTTAEAVGRQLARIDLPEAAA